MNVSAQSVKPQAGALRSPPAPGVGGRGGRGRGVAGGLSLWGRAGGVGEEGTLAPASPGGACGPAWDFGVHSAWGWKVWDGLEQTVTLSVRLGLLFVKMCGPCREEDEAWDASEEGATRTSQVSWIET